MEKQLTTARERLNTPVAWMAGVGGLLVLAYVVSLFVRPVGSYVIAVDGWGVATFELTFALVVTSRFFSSRWRSSPSAAKTFPLVLGAACFSWALGDVASTFEKIGGNVAVPSVADLFFVGFYPLCFFAFVQVTRRGSYRSMLATSLDGIIAGLGVAAISGAFAFSWLVNRDGGSALATATTMAYPVGDVLLTALAVAGLSILPKQHRRFLFVAVIALAMNAVGDTFNLLLPASRIGYVTNSCVWQISILMLAVAAWLQPAAAKGRSFSAEEAAAEKVPGLGLPIWGGIAGLSVLVAAVLGHPSRWAIAIATVTLGVSTFRLFLSLRESQVRQADRIRSLIDNTWDLISIIEADTRIVFVTPSASRLIGSTPAEVRGRRLAELLHPDDADALLLCLAELAPGTTESGIDLRVRRSDGAWRIFSWTVSNLLENPSVAGFVMNGTDVTNARRDAEDLASARDTALRASEAKSSFLSTMSHEIRTPMNGVIGLTDLLLDTELDSDQLELTSGVKVSAENLLVIINDILDFSKIEAGKLDVEAVPFDLRAVAEDVGRILATPAAHNQVELLIDVDPALPEQLVGDRVRLQQVLLNFGSNAVKFSLETEVLIRIAIQEQKDGRLTIRFEVVDHGIGIAPEDQDRLFEAFTQADSSTTRKFGGTGLGLAICRQLIELMGGTLGLVSSPGEGSTFWFDLMLETTDAEEAKPRQNRRGLENRRALVVDDNATNRMILRRQLASWGVESDEAEDGASALAVATTAAAAGRPFDLAVLDLNMPGMDGMELAATLKAVPTTASCRLVLLSSSGDRLPAAELEIWGFEAGLIKPVRPSELFDALATAMGVADDEGSDFAVMLPKVTPVGACPAPSAPKAHVLLVEDNSTNQMVASKVLSKLGYSYDLANNGREAVEWVEVGDYAAILMDCQMPEMDGYEATAAIRARDDERRTIPIIAMTAAAMEGDREVCLAAGMDDYVTKPIRADVVAAALERWTGTDLPNANEEDDTEAMDVETKGRTGDPKSGESAISTERIDLLLDLDDGAGEVLNEIIDEYLSQASIGRDTLEASVNSDAGATLAAAAHSLKGASANVGAKDVATLCAAIEERDRIGDLDAAKVLVGQVRPELDRAERALRRFRRKVMT